MELEVSQIGRSIALDVGKVRRCLCGVLRGRCTFLLSYLRDDEAEKQADTLQYSPRVIAEQLERTIARSRASKLCNIAALSFFLKDLLLITMCIARTIGEIL